MCSQAETGNELVHDRAPNWIHNPCFQGIFCTLARLVLKVIGLLRYLPVSYSQELSGPPPLKWVTGTEVMDNCDGPER